MFQRAITIVLMCPLTACSFALVKSPPPATASPTQSTGGCTRSGAAPAVDVVFATPAIGGGVFFAAGAAGTNDEAIATVFGIGAGVLLVTGAAFGSSAAYGFVTTNECRARYAGRSN